MVSSKQISRHPYFADQQHRFIKLHLCLEIQLTNEIIAQIHICSNPIYEMLK